MTHARLSRRSILASAAMIGGACFLPSLARSQSRSFAAAVDYSTARNGVSLIVEQAGVVLHESYAGDGGPAQGWELASGTKSFSGLMAAALVHDRLLRLDEACSATLPEWRNNPAKALITIRQLLSLSSGIAGGAIGRPPTFAEAIEAPSVAPAGSLFSYGPVPFQIFGEIARRKLGSAGSGDSDPLAYLQRRLFDPLAIAPTHWRRGGDGLPHLPSGAGLSARHWLRFGRFVLDAAARTPKHGDPAVDHSTLMACLTPQGANPGYGLTWWLPAAGMTGPSRNARRNAQVTDDMAGLAALGRVWMAAGAGNQRLYLMPDRNMVIVRQANRILDSRRIDWSDQALGQLVLDALE